MKKNFVKHAPLILAVTIVGFVTAGAASAYGQEVSPSASTQDQNGSQTGLSQIATTASPSLSNPASNTGGPTSTMSSGVSSQPTASQGSLSSAPTATITSTPTVSYTTVLWKMPGNVTTWPQGYVAETAGDNLGAYSVDTPGLTCGTSYQVDVYDSSKVAALTADHTLTEGEDYGIALHWTTFTTPDCEVTPSTPPSTTPSSTPTPVPTGTPSPEAPPVSPSPTTSPTPSPSSTVTPPSPSATPQPTKPSTSANENSPGPDTSNNSKREASTTPAGNPATSTESELAYTGSTGTNIIIGIALFLIAVGLIVIIARAVNGYRRNKN